MADFEEEDVLDAAAHANLLKQLKSLDGNSKKIGRERSVRISSDFLPELDLKVALKKIGNEKLADKNLEPLAKPLEKPVAKRLKRAAGYEETAIDANRWEGLVEQRRKADSLIFPLDQSRVGIVDPTKPTPKALSRNPLEEDIYSLLNGARLIKPKASAEELQVKKAMSLKEIRERSKEIWKRRLLNMRLEKKAALLNKSKSRKYRRILRREKIRKKKEEFERLKEKDPAAALAILKELDDERVNERMSLRHKNSRWLNTQRIRLGQDQSAKSVLKESADMRTELLEKIKPPKDDDSEGESEDGINDVLKDQENWVKSGNLDQSNRWVSQLAVPQEKEKEEEVASFYKTKMFWEEFHKRKIQELEAQKVAEMREQEMKAKEIENEGTEGSDEPKNHRKATVSDETEEKEGEETTDCGTMEVSKTSLEEDENPLKKDDLNKTSPKCESTNEKKKKVKKKDKSKNNETKGIKKKNLSIKAKNLKTSETNVLKQKVKKKKVKDDNEDGKVEEKVSCKKDKKTKTSRKLKKQEKINDTTLESSPGKKEKKNKKSVAKKNKVPEKKETLVKNTKKLSSEKQPSKKKIKKNLKRKSESDVQITKTKSKPKIQEGSEEENIGSDVPDDIFVDDVFDRGEERLINKIKKKLSEKQSFEEEESNPQDEKNTTNPINSAPEFMDFDFTAKEDAAPNVESVERVRTLEDIDKIPVIEKRNISLTELVSKDPKESAATPPLMSVNLQDGDITKIKTRKLIAPTPDHVFLRNLRREKDDSDASESDSEDGLGNLFDEDEEMKEFLEEKKRHEDENTPKDIDLHLHGWGHWAGPGIVPSKERMKKFRIEAPKKPPNKYTNIGNVIYNEKSDVHENLRRLMVNEVPAPFASVKDFEASLRHPIGRKYIPEANHRKIIAPKVVTKLGKVIHPMGEEVLLTHHKKLKKKSSKLESKLEDEIRKSKRQTTKEARRANIRKESRGKVKTLSLKL